MIEQPYWHRLFENDFPPPNIPLWIAHEGTVQPGQWQEDHDGPICDTYFTAPDGRNIYGTFWCLIEDVNEPPSYPGWNDVQSVPDGYKCGWPPESDTEPWKGYWRLNRLDWKQLLRQHKLLPPEEDVVSWQSIARAEYPPTSGEPLWTAHRGKVCKGRWLFMPSIPLKENAFEDEAGNPIAVSFWCPLDDSVEAPEAPAED